MAINEFALVAAALTAFSLILVFVGMLLLYARLKASFRRRNQELGEMTARLEAESEERRKREHDLAESELRIRQLAESLPVGLLICDEDGYFTYANSVGARLFRTSPERILGRHYAPHDVPWQLLDRDGRPLEDAQNPFTRVLETGRPVVDAEYLFSFPDTLLSTYSVSASPLVSSDGRMRGLIASVQDVTDFSRTREELAHQRQFFEELFLQSTVATQIFDREGNRLRSNAEWRSLFAGEHGRSGSSYNIFDDSAIIHAGLATELRRVVADGVTVVREIPLETGDDGDDMRWFRIKAFPVRGGDGEVANMIVHYDEVSDQRRADERLRRSLEEKELLLKEIHHRVKNNMQLMKSMLHLQSAYISDPATLRMFTESANRINTMALIHEKLYQSENFGRVAIRDYLTYIADSLYQTYATPEIDINIKTELDDVVLDIDTAIPCGLLANELISNALKHAFDGRSRGVVLLSFKQTAIDLDGQPASSSGYLLSVTDNGCGISPDPGGPTHSLGLKLVGSLVQQLAGELTVTDRRRSGTIVEVKFPTTRGTHLRTVGVRLGN